MRKRYFMCEVGAGAIAPPRTGGDSRFDRRGPKARELAGCLAPRVRDWSGGGQRPGVQTTDSARPAPRASVGVSRHPRRRREERSGRCGEARGQGRGRGHTWSRTWADIR